MGGVMMIYNYPFFGVPNYLNFNSNAYSPNSNYHSPSINHTPNASSNILSPSYTTFRRNSNAKTRNYPYEQDTRKFIAANTSTTNSSKKNQEDIPYFSLFGMSLYFDDILLICVILFLFNEKVDDYYLLLALILLLLG